MVGYGDGTVGLDSPWEVLFTNLVLSLGEVVAQADISTILYQRTLICFVAKTILMSLIPWE
jgi:hypothetical protein